MAGEAMQMQAMAALNAAIWANAEASAFAIKNDTSLAMAKAALASAANQVAAAAKAEAAAQRAAAKEASDAAKASAKESANAAKEEASARKSALKEEEAEIKQWKKECKEAEKEAAAAAKESANAQKSAAKDWQDSGDLMTSPIEAAKKALNGMGPEGQAVAVALSIATAGVVALSAAIVGGMTVAIGVVEKATQRLAVFSALGGSAAAGKATVAMVERLSQKLPQSTDQLTSWATAMQRAGLEGKGLESAVKAIAAASAINPEGGAEAAQQAISKLSGEGKGAAAFLKQVQQEAGKGEKSLREMGLSMADLGGKAAVAKMNAKQLQAAMTAALVKKGAGPLDAMSNTFPVIIAKAKEGLTSIFSGLGKSVEPFMASVKSMFAMFNNGGPMVAILKPIITSVFGTLFSLATRAVNFVHSAFQQIVIAGLKVRIAVQPIVVAFRQLYAEVSKAVAATGLFTGKSTVLAAVMGFVKTAIVASFQFAVIVVTGFVKVLAGMATFATMVITKVRGVFKNLNLPSLASAAANMVTSFISGIASKIGSVVAAMMGMGAAAKKGLLGALGIASPSKVAQEAAGNVTSSFANKVDDGKPTAQKAFSGLVTPPPGGASGSGGKGSAPGPLVAALNRVADALEASPGLREALLMAVLEAQQEGP